MQVASSMFSEATPIVKSKHRIDLDEVARALNEAGSVSGAARILGVPRSTFEYWMLKLGISLRKVAVIRGRKTPRK